MNPGVGGALTKGLTRRGIVAAAGEVMRAEGWIG